MIIIIMGVSGAGKTTIGKALSEVIHGLFIDADDYHPQANKEKMKQGMALTDEDRKPWLRALNQQLHQQQAQQQKKQQQSPQHAPTIVACSALKSRYRDQLVEGLPEKSIRWVYLKGDIATIRKRMQARPHEYMPVALLESQFEILEEPENALVIEVAQGRDEIVKDIMQAYC